MVTLNDVLTFRLRQYVEQNGNLLPIEFDKTIPFKPKRTFFCSSGICFRNVGNKAVPEVYIKESEINFLLFIC